MPRVILALPLVAVPLVVGLLLPTTTAQASTPPDRLLHTAVLAGTTSDNIRKQGADVAVSGDGNTVVVAAPPTNYATHAAGQVYVFTRSAAGSWNLQATLHRAAKPADLPSNTRDWGTAVAISADGGHIAVGNPDDSAAGVPGQPAAVDLFVRAGSAWLPDGSALDPHLSPYTGFGRSLALSADGGKLLVGEPSYHGPETGYGADGVAWVYRRTGAASWADPKELVPPKSPGYVLFGQDVALSEDGSTAVAGAIARAVTADDNLGAVFVFTANGVGGWYQSHSFTDPGRGRDAFGQAVAVTADGQTIAIGNPWAKVPTVAVFHRQPGVAWVRTALFTGVDTAVDGRFGQALAISADGSTLLTGAPERTANNGSVPAAGGGYRYVQDAAGWHFGGQLNAPTARPYENTGAAVALSTDGEVAVVGAPFYGRDYPDSFAHPGSSYVFTRKREVPWESLHAQCLSVRKLGYNVVSVNKPDTEAIVQHVKGGRRMSTLWVRHATDGAATARRNVADALTKAGLSDETAYEAALITSELVANAVRHGSALPSGHLAVEWSINAAGYLISVTDGGNSAPPVEAGHPITPRQAAPQDTAGRGLAIVAALSSSWGVNDHHAGTTVWARGRFHSADAALQHAQ